MKAFLEAHRQTFTLALPFSKRLVGSYIEKLFKGKCEASLVICGSFGGHITNSLLEDFLVPIIGLDQSLEACNDFHSLLIELERGNANTDMNILYVYIKNAKIPQKKSVQML